MKTILLIVTMILGIGSARTQADEVFDIDLLNQRIDALIDAKMHLADTDIGHHFRKQHPEFIALKDLLEANWQRSLEGMEEWSGGEGGERLVWAAMQELPPVAYMSAFEWMVNKLVAGEVDKSEVVAFMSGSGSMDHFLSDNHQHARVIAALSKLKIKVADDAELTERIENILDGSNKRDLDGLREDHEHEWEANWPKFILE